LTSLLEGRAEEALHVIRTSQVDDEDRLHIEALAEHSLGHDARSRRALDELTSRYSILMPFEIASAYAWRGERDAAFEWLDRCDRQLDSGLMFVKRWPLLRDLRADPRWSRFLQGVNLPVD
jgi:serine/threonine-protein kinase